MCLEVHVVKRVSKNITVFISTISILLSTLVPYQILSAQEKEPLINMTQLLELDDPSVFGDVTELKETNEIITALEKGQLQDIPREVLDPFMLLDQKVIDKKKENIYEIGTTDEHVPLFSYDDIEFKVEENKLAILGVSEEDVVVKQVFDGLEIFDIYEMPKNVYLIVKVKRTNTKKIIVLDKYFVRHFAFRSPLPMFTIYHFDKDTAIPEESINSNTKLAVIGRGTRPFSKNEVLKFIEDSPNKKKILFEEGQDKRPKIQSGQIVVYNSIESKERTVEGVLSNEVIAQKLHQGGLIFSLKAAMANNQVIEQSFFENYKKMWNVYGNRPNVGKYPKILKYYIDELLKKTNQFIEFKNQGELEKSSSQKELILELLKNYIDDENFSGIDLESDSFKISEIKNLIDSSPRPSLYRLDRGLVSYKTLELTEKYKPKGDEKIQKLIKKRAREYKNNIFEKYKVNTSIKEELRILLGMDNRLEENEDVNPNKVAWDFFDDELNENTENEYKEKVKKIFSKINKKSIEDTIDQLKDNEEYGLNFEFISGIGWKRTYEIVIRQAYKSLTNLQIAINSAKVADKHFLIEKRNLVLEQIRSGDFNISLFAYIEEYLKNKSLIAQKEKGFWDFSKINVGLIKKITKITLITVTIGTSLHIGTTELWTSFPDWIQNTLDLFADSKFHRIISDAEYRGALLSGSTLLMMLYPLVLIISAVSIPSVRLINYISTKNAKEGKNSISQNLKIKTNKILSIYKDLDLVQKMITSMSRLYRYLIWFFPNWIDKASGQQAMEVMKAGFSPFKTAIDEKSQKRVLLATNNILPSFLGEIIAGEKNVEQLRNGNIFQRYVQSSRDKYKKKMDLLKKVESKERKAVILVNYIASLVMTEKDPVTTDFLFRLHNQRMSAEEFFERNFDNDFSEKHRYISQELYREVLSKQDYDQIDLEDQDNLKELIAIGKKYFEKTQSKKWKLYNYKSKLTPQTSKLWKILGSFSEDEFKFLGSVVANKFVSRQVNSEWLQDHVIVVYMTALFGKRADLEQPNVISHVFDNIFFTTKEHFQDILLNFYVHCMKAGPRRMLISQSLESEKTYNNEFERRRLNSQSVPLNEEFLKFSNRRENAWAGLFKWTKALLNFKENNIGGYYQKEIYNLFRTMQASLISMVFFRLYFSEQVFSEAIMGSLFILIAAIRTYMWPWTALARGNEIEDQRVQKSFEKTEKALQKIYTASKNNNLSEMISAHNMLMKETLDGKKISQNDYLNEYESKIIEKTGMKISRKDFKKMKELMYSNNGELFKEMATYISGVENKNDKLATESIENIQNILKSKSSLNLSKDQIIQRINSSVDLIRKIPPKVNQANPRVQFFSTLLFGAMLTTLLAVSMFVDSFDKENLVFEKLYDEFYYLFIFAIFTFLLTSQWSYENYQYKIFGSLYDLFLRPTKKYYHARKRNKKSESKNNSEINKCENIFKK